MGFFRRHVTLSDVLSAVDEVRLRELGEPGQRDLDAMLGNIFGDQKKNAFYVVEAMSWFGGVIKERFPRARLDEIIGDCLGRGVTITTEWAQRVTGEPVSAPSAYALVAMRELVSRDFLGRPDQLHEWFLAKFDDESVSLKTRALYLPTLVSTAGCIAARLEMNFEYS
jgi:hypothetical protein